MIGFGEKIYGYPSDALATVWHLWWQNFAPQKGLDPRFCPLLDAPWGKTLEEANQPLFWKPLHFLSSLLGPTTAYNLGLLLALAIAALTTFLLVRHLTSRKAPALLAALIYSLSQYNLWHGMQNLEIIMGIAWLPLYVLALVQFVKTLTPSSNLEPRTSNGTLKAALLTALAFALVFLTSIYIGYFAILFTIGFFVLSLLKRFSTALQRTVEQQKCLPRNGPGTNIPRTTILRSVVVPLYQRAKRSVLPLSAHWLPFATFCFIFTLPATYPMLRYYLKPQDLSPQSQNIRQTLELRQFDEVIAYGARPWDYLIPSIFHPVFGKHVENFYAHLEKNFTFQFWSPYLPERVNFIPLTVLALAGYAIIHTILQRPRPPSLRSGVAGAATSDFANVLTFAALALWMFWISLPAKITIRSIPFYSPSYFLFRLFPMFRVYARAGIFVLLCVTVLAGYGLKFLLERCRDAACRGDVACYVSTKITKILIPLVFGLVLFENLNFPPFHLLDLSKTPEVYTWLASQPEEITIVEYPRDMEPGGGCTPNVDPWIRKDYCPSCSLYFQTIHQKAIFTGDSLEPEDRQAIADLSSEETHRILSENGVDLIVVHTQDPFPQKNPLDSCQSRRIMEKPEKVAPGFKLIERFDGAIVLRVEPQT